MDFYYSYHYDENTTANKGLCAIGATGQQLSYISLFKFSWGGTIINRPFGLNCIQYFYPAFAPGGTNTNAPPDAKPKTLAVILLRPLIIKKTNRSMPQVLINDIIRQLNEIHDGSLWFDQCFKDKIDYLSVDDAFAKPIPQVHSVAEHVSHMLEWRKECLLRFAGKRTELMNSPDDWKNNIELQAYGWTNLKTAFYNSRYELIHQIENRDDTYLETKFLDTDYNFHYLIEGIIQHDLYHLGQIGITVKLINENKNYR